MRYVRVRVVVGAMLGLLLLWPGAGFGQDDEEPALYDCGERQCGEWKAKGDNTCRSCTTMQCKKAEGGEVIAGSKKQNECYEGHGPPPEDDE